MAEVLSKTALVDKVAEAAGVSKKDTKAVVDALMETVKESVGKDAEIRLIGFGTFKKAQRAARKGRNPQSADWRSNQHRSQRKSCFQVQREILIQAKSHPSGWLFVWGRRHVRWKDYPVQK